MPDYANPPIREAICEFRFSEDEDWDLTVPGLMYPALAAELPVKRTKRQHEFGFRQGDHGGEIAGSITDWMQFLTEDEKMVVQVGPHRLTVNHLRPYTCWKTFFALVKRALNAFVETDPGGLLVYQSVRYINDIRMPETSVRASDYLVLAPNIPAEIGNVMSSWGQRLEVPDPELQGLLILQTASVADQERSSLSLTLDLELLRRPQLDLDEAHAIGWLERGHQKVEDAFESCITDHARRLFVEDGITDDLQEA